MMVRLRKECEHGRYDGHDFDNAWQGVSDCPGGEFLLEGATNRMHSVLRMWNPDLNDYAIQKCAKELFDALASQVGESER